MAPKLTVHPLTPARWADFEQLFGPRGACGGCWCMAMRLPKAQYHAGKTGGNKRRMKARVLKGPPPGVLGYLGQEPVAWCSVGPREEFDALARSRVLKPVDGQPVWSLTCLYVRKDQRRQGLMPQIVKGAAALARKRGARLLEAYPTENPPQLPDVFLWTGIASGFERAGFREAARRSKARPILRMKV